MPTRIRIVYVDPFADTRGSFGFDLVVENMFDLVATTDRLEEGLTVATKLGAHALVVACQHRAVDRIGFAAAYDEALKPRLVALASRVRIILLSPISELEDDPDVKSGVLAYFSTNNDRLGDIRRMCSTLVHPAWDPKVIERGSLTREECDFLFHLGRDPVSAEQDDQTKALLPSVLEKIGLSSLESLRARSRALHRHVRSVDQLS